MKEESWSEKAIGEFFAARQAPTRHQCNQLALSISGTSAVRPVDVPGSLSYTVVGGTPVDGQPHTEAQVVSFREPDSTLDERIVSLARIFHGVLVPQAISHGLMQGSEPPLHIYTMPLLPGVACLDVLSYQAQMDAAEGAKTVCFVTHLARYLKFNARLLLLA
jgi:hypothetical protein